MNFIGSRGEPSMSTAVTLKDDWAMTENEGPPTLKEAGGDGGERSSRQRRRHCTAWNTGGGTVSASESVMASESSLTHWWRRRAGTAAHLKRLVLTQSLRHWN